MDPVSVSERDRSCDIRADVVPADDVASGGPAEVDTVEVVSGDEIPTSRSRAADRNARLTARRWILAVDLSS